MKKPTQPRAADSAQSAEQSEMIRAHLDACVDVDEKMLREANAAILAHTPGPWRARPFVDERFSPARTGYDIEGHPDFNNGFALAHVSGSAEMHANARLIAAAPALLKELRILTDWVDANVSDPAAICLIGSAHAAIAAATGDART